jgi:hypothetical protein
VAHLQIVGEPGPPLEVPDTWFVHVGERLRAGAPEHLPGFERMNAPYEHRLVGPEALEGSLRALRALVEAERRPYEQQLQRQGQFGRSPWVAEAIEKKLGAGWPAYALTRQVIELIERAVALGQSVAIDGD